VSFEIVDECVVGRQMAAVEGSSLSAKAAKRPSTSRVRLQSSDRQIEVFILESLFET
jgi:hypothetical protein